MKHLAFALSFCLSSLSTSTSYAQIFTANAVPTGNALISPPALEQVIQKAIANAVKGEFFKSHLMFTIPAIHTSVPFEPKPGSLKLLKALGLQGPLDVTINPIRIAMTLPESGLKISVKKNGEDHFEIDAHWSITRLIAQCQSLQIHVPQGLFDQSFDITSTPVDVALRKDKGPITMDVAMTVDLDEQGATYQIQSVTTNVTSSQEADPYLSVKLGELAVNGELLDLEFTSNGQSMHPTEPEIREQLQTIEPKLVLKIRDAFQKSLEERVQKMSFEQSQNPPLKISISTSELLSNIQNQPDLQPLMHDMDFRFVLRNIERILYPNLYSTQISSQACFDNQCVSDRINTSRIDRRDYMRMEGPTESTNDNTVGALIYESWLQNILHSDAFEARFRKYFLSQHVNDGVGLAPDGIRVHLNPQANAIVVVLNLSIDLMQKGKTDESIKTQFGSRVEKAFGGGNTVFAPVELTFRINGIKKDEHGTNLLNLVTEFPFQQNGRMKNTYHYPSSIDGDKMTDAVRKGVVAALKEQIQEGYVKTTKANSKNGMINSKKWIAPMVPATISFPLGRTFGNEDYHFAPRSLVVTPNHGLLLKLEMVEKTASEKMMKL